MAYVLAALTFFIIAMVLVAVVAVAGGGDRQSVVVRKRLEAIERGERRGSESLQLKLIRDELLSEVPAFNRILVKWSGSHKLRDFVSQAGLKIKPGRLILMSGVLALGAYLTLVNIYHNPVLALLGLLGGVLAPFVYVAFMRSRRLRAFEKQFPEAIDLLGRAVRAGHSFTSGLEMIAGELAEPVASEFRTTFEEQNFGLPLRDALLNLTERVPLIDVQFFVTALLIQKETGGNLAEILDNLSHVVRERFRIYGEVRVKTAQGRLTAGILISIPPFMILVMRVVNPSYIQVLFEDPAGPYILAGAAILQAIGSIILWKIVNIEV
jgi:tight adherence protein B